MTSKQVAMFPQPRVVGAARLYQPTHKPDRDSGRGNQRVSKPLPSFTTVYRHWAHSSRSSPPIDNLLVPPPASHTAGLTLICFRGQRVPLAPGWS